MSADAHIDEIVLRVPGLGREQARDVGERVARALAERIARDPSLSADLGALELRLSVPPGAPLDRVVEQVVNAVVDRLRT